MCTKELSDFGRKKWLAISCTKCLRFLRLLILQLRYYKCIKRSFDSRLYGLLHFMSCCHVAVRLYWCRCLVHIRKCFAQKNERKKEKNWRANSIFHRRHAKQSPEMNWARISFSSQVQMRSLKWMQFHFMESYIKEQIWVYQIRARNVFFHAKFISFSRNSVCNSLELVRIYRRIILLHPKNHRNRQLFFLSLFLKCSSKI